MQLHPFYATVSRPIYWDRDGYLYQKACCPECGGDGQYEVAADFRPDGRTKWHICDTCRGDGEVYEEIAEDDVIENQQKETV